MIEMTTINARYELHILLHARYVVCETIHIYREDLTVLLLKVCIIGILITFN